MQFRSCSISGNEAVAIADDSLESIAIISVLISFIASSLAQKLETTLETVLPQLDSNDFTATANPYSRAFPSTSCDCMQFVFL